MLRNLVISFDCDEGLSESIFDHARELIFTMLGTRSAKVFSNYVDATEGRFYLKEDASAECWEKMCEEAKHPEN
jgi:hypothetical protein